MTTSHPKSTQTAIRRLTLAAALLSAALIGPAVAEDCDDGCQAAKGLKGLERVYGPGGMLDDCMNNDCNGVDNLPGIEKEDPLDNPQPEPQEPAATPEPDTYVPDCRPGQPC